MLILAFWCAALVAILWFLTLLIQGYIYTEPATGLHWRVPASVVVLGLFLAPWWLLIDRSPPRRYDTGSVAKPYDTVFRFNPRAEKEFTEIWDENKTHYFLRKGQGYHTDGLPSRKWSTTRKVVVKEDGQDVEFKAEVDAKGNFMRERKSIWGLGWLVGPGQEQPLRYRDKSGRIMTENEVGRVSTFRWGLFLANILLNLLHFLVWFACLWLLLRYQWHHALGLASIFWLVTTLLKPGA